MLYQMSNPNTVMVCVFYMIFELFWVIKSVLNCKILQKLNKKWGQKYVETCEEIVFIHPKKCDKSNLFPKLPIHC